AIEVHKSAPLWPEISRQSPSQGAAVDDMFIRAIYPSDGQLLTLARRTVEPMMMACFCRPVLFTVG
ncbi:hypothetical protein Trydic_g18405, partial [Trypoxylus dichotomus]